MTIHLMEAEYEKIKIQLNSGSRNLFSELSALTMIKMLISNLKMLLTGY